MLSKNKGDCATNRLNKLSKSRPFKDSIAIKTSFNIDYHGLRNKLPNEKEIVGSYFSARDFFQDRAKWHNKSADWYLDYADQMEAKARKHIRLVNVAERSANEYSELIARAYLNGFLFHPVSNNKGCRNAK